MEEVNFRLFRIGLFLILSFFSSESSAQNLVYNGSFELFSKRPVSAEYFLHNAQIHYCKGWDASCSTLYDSCGNTDYYIYKANYESQSWQQPKRPFDQKAFIGIYLFDCFPKDVWLNEGPLYREYASGKLITPLVVGKKYRLNIAHTNGQFPLRDNKPFAHDGFGILLSTFHPVQNADYSKIILKPQFRTPYLMSDSVWRVMDFEFVADSAYSIITLGNFYNPEDINIVKYNNASESFVYFDNLIIEPIVDLPKLPSPITICKSDSVWIENKEKKPVEWWINGVYWGWAVGLKHFYTNESNTIIVKYYHDYDTTFVFIKNKPEVVLKQEGYLCPWSDKKGFVSFHNLDSLSSYYWQWQGVKSFNTTLSINKPSLISFIYTSPKQCEWHEELQTNDTCPLTYDCFFPNSFSPNNDGLNDGYNIECENLVEYEMRIFNRWGEQIFYTLNPLEEWDGTYKYNKCETGVYLAVIKVKYPTDESNFKTKTQKINLNLIR